MNRKTNLWADLRDAEKDERQCRENVADLETDLQIAEEILALAIKKTKEARQRIRIDALQAENKRLRKALDATVRNLLATIDTLQAENKRLRKALPEFAGH